MDMIRRWRNTRGFGVHSPFGYAIARCVVRPDKKYGYYGYGLLRDAEGRACPRKIRKKCEMFLRLVCLLRPESIYLPPTADPLFFAMAKAADSRIHIATDKKDAAGCTMIAADAATFPETLLQSHLSQPGNAVVLENADETVCRNLFDSMDEGIMVRGKRNAIIIARTGMQKVDYRMNI